MKNILIVIFCALSFQAYGQLPGLRRIKSETADSLYIKGGGVYPVRHVRTTLEEYHCYLLDSDDTTTLRKTPRASG